MPWVDKSFSKLVRAGRYLENKSITVGIVQPATHTSQNGRTIDMAYLYDIQDNGRGRIPKRETLRPAIDNFNPAEQAGGLFADMAQGRSHIGLNRIGRAASKAVKQEIEDIDSPALSDYTLSARRRRGNMSANPLVDTGQLKRAINYKLK